MPPFPVLRDDLLRLRLSSLELSEFTRRIDIEGEGKASFEQRLEFHLCVTTCLCTCIFTVAIDILITVYYFRHALMDDDIDIFLLLG